MTVTRMRPRTVTGAAAGPGISEPVSLNHRVMSVALALDSVGSGWSHNYMMTGAAPGAGAGRRCRGRIAGIMPVSDRMPRRSARRRPRRRDSDSDRAPAPGIMSRYRR